MNIERLFPESELHVYKVTDVITPSQVKLLVKLAAGHLPTGYRQDDLDQAVQDIRNASIEACKTIFGDADLEATEENKRWPWFDLSAGESREAGHGGIYEDETETVSYFTEFVVRQSDGGGEVVFSNGVPINLNPGEMLVASRASQHQFEITEIESGMRWTLLTHIFVK